MLGHKILKKRIEINKEIKFIKKFPPPIYVRGIERLFENVGFHRRFIKDFFNISLPKYKLLENEMKDVVVGSYLKAFVCLKKKLTLAPIIVSPDWSILFEVICDNIGVAVGEILGQKHEKILL